MSEKTREILKQLEEKRKEVLESIKPIMEAFEITDYDYVVKAEGRTETLVINGQKIGCSANSINAIIDEVIGYLFVKIYSRNRYIGAFRTQTLNVIKQYWLN